MVYLDHNATTPLCPEALEAMLPFLGDAFGNPSSIHAAGRKARAAVDDARDRLAAALGVRPSEIVFTGGGTESCNLAILGIARAHQFRGKHLVTSAIEHHAVLHAFEYLHHFEGFDLTILPVLPSGRIAPESLRAALRPDTTLVSVLHANNETGVVQDLGEMAEICARSGVFFHTDAVQSFGKIPVRPGDSELSALSLAAHKFHGPKGVGALFLKDGIALARASHGGAQENSRRPGTENVVAIVGMAAAAEVALAAKNQHCRLLREQLWHGISGGFPGAIRNGDPEFCLDNTLNVSFPGADGEALLMSLDLEGVCTSGGSACMVGSMKPSHVLLAMGAAPKTALASIRFSLGRDTSAQDIEFAIRAVGRALSLQSLCA